jgi:hypothetical protein
MPLIALICEIQLLMFKSLNSVDDAHHLAWTCRGLNALFEENRLNIFSINPCEPDFQLPLYFNI